MPDVRPVPSVRERFLGFLRDRAPRRSDLKGDTVASLPLAVGSVPDGLAMGTLVGVNPVFGVYAAMVGGVVGGLTASTRMMLVSTTTAAALAAGSALADVAMPDRSAALVTLTVLTGAVMIAAGLLRLGRVVRFVSHSVMLGFLAGVCVNIVLSQLPDLLGADSGEGLAAVKAARALAEPGAWDPATAVIGLATVALLFLVARTRLATLGPLFAVVVPTVVVLVVGLDSVADVSDAGDIPAGLPAPALPQLDVLSLDLVVGAFAIAAIALIQGAGVAQAAPNVGGAAASTNGDFISQGLSNVGSGLFHGIPVGGSVGSTAFSLAAGGRSRWASILTGVWIALILVAFSELVGLVVSATLAALLIYAGITSLSPGQMLLAWRSGTTAKVAMVVTLAATLALPIAAAVGVGIVVSLLLQLNRDSLDLAVVQLTGEDGKVIEHPVPDRLEDGQLVVLDVYGSLLYAGARTLDQRLPDPDSAQRAVVVLRLRGRSSLGATFFAVITSYAERLAARGGRLYLSGLDPDLVSRFHGAIAPDTLEGVRAFEATEVVGESTLRAVRAGRAWLVASSPGPDGVRREPPS